MKILIFCQRERVTKAAKTEIREQRGGFLKTLVGTLGSTC